MDQINQLSDFNQAQEDQQLNSNENVHPDLHPSHQISTAPGRYNPYPVHFQRRDGILEQSDSHGEDNSPSNEDKTNAGLSASPSNHRPGGHVSSGFGRSSVMLGEDGKPIPEDQKPPQGTEEWSRMRRINHKEVERKRRQTINEGIDELARLISNQSASAEKNKGAVLQKACNFISALKAKESTQLEKHTMEKLLCDQSIAELQATNTHLLQQLQLAQQRGDLWKATAQGDESARIQAQAMDTQ